MDAGLFDARLGGVIFSLTEPNRGHRGAFDRWYRRDHRYAGALAGPGVVGGQRWQSATESTPADLDERPSSTTNGAGSRLAIFLLIEGAWDEFHAWSGPRLASLRADGRMFDERRRIHGRHYVAEHGSGPGATWEPPPLDAVDRPYQGLLAVLGTERPPADDRPLPVARPAAAQAGGVVAPDGIDVTLRSDACPANDEMDLGSHVLVLALRNRPWTSDGDVIATQARALASRRGLAPVWASTFVPQPG